MRTVRIKGMTEEQALLMEALDTAADELWDALEQKTRAAMTAVGEDPDGPMLFLRMNQVANGLASRAGREWDQACMRLKIKDA